MATTAVERPDSELEHRVADSAPSSVGVKRWFVGLGLVLVTLVGWDLSHDYRTSLQSAHIRITSTSILLEEWLSDYFRVSDNVLKTLAAATDPRDLRFPHPDPEVSARMKHRLLELRTIIPNIDELGLMNAEGVLVHTTGDDRDVGFDVSQRDFFAVLHDDPSRSTYLSPVFWSSYANAYKLVQSRTVRDPMGGFGGAAGVRLDIDFFSGWLDRVQHADGAVIAILDTDMTVIAFRPHASAWMAASAGRRATDPALVDFIASGLHRLNYRSRSTIDGVERVFSAAKVPGIPIVVVVGQPVAGVLAPWRRKAWMLGGGLLCILGLGFAGVRAYLQLREHDRVLRGSRAALEQSNTALAREVAERKTSEDRFRGLFENSLSGVALNEIILDEAGRPCDYRFLMVNDAFERQCGLSADQVIGKRYSELGPGLNDPHLVEIFGSVALTGEPVAFEYHGEGWGRYFSVAVFKVGHGRFAAVFDDITARKRAEAEVRDLAFYDPLTRLPNRRLLLDRLRHTIAISQRNGCWSALLFMDLDDFKLLNDSLGHDKGDLLLRRIAVELQACLRETDTIARLGGDEFVIIFEHICERDEDPTERVERLGQKLLAAVGSEHDLDGHAHRASASIGVTFIGANAASLEELMKQADMAMYEAKAAGRDTMRFFDPAMQAAVNERAVLEAEMRSGIERGEFVVHYQQQVDVAHRTVGMEALLRWQHRQRGLLAPAVFIEMAERTGLIVPLGRFVLRSACAQLARWAGTPETAGLTIAVNISPRQFHEHDVVAMVRGIIESTGAPPQRLMLEITESMLLHNIDAIIATMNELKAIGVGFSLDDFGTGYSSLAYLKQLPFDEVKIDQSFVRDVLIDANDAAIARTIIALAQSLELAVVAEGVEQRAQLDWLAEQGCKVFQGYFFGHPAPIGPELAAVW